MSEFSKKLDAKMRKSREEKLSLHRVHSEHSPKPRVFWIGVVACLSFMFALSAYGAMTIFHNFESKKAYEAEQAKNMEVQAKLIIDSQQKALSDAQAEIEKLKVTNTETQKKQSELEKKMQSTQKTPTSISISTSDLSKYLSGVMQIKCGDVSGSLSLWKLAGSGGATYFGITNAHVIESASGVCLLFPGTDSYTSSNQLNKTMATVNVGSAYSWNNFTDVAIMPIKNAFRPIDGCSGSDCSENIPVGDLNYSVSSLPRCQAKIPIGSPVVAVGFPAFGIQEHDISGYTSTASFRISSDGIISGYNSLDAAGSPLPYNNYFISAKIDSGNSGGIVISKTSAGLCVLGIPTWIALGHYETNGLVQNIHNVMSK